AAVVHEFAENRPEQKQWEKLSEETGAAAHEDLRPARKQRFAAEKCGDERRCRREQENTPPPKGKPDQQTKPNQNPQEAHFSALGQQHIEIGSGAFPRSSPLLSGQFSRWSG